MVERKEIKIETGGERITADLCLPENPKGMVVFAHGSGSSRHSPRNKFVADVLNEAGLGTLLVDLLTPGEANSRANVFDVELLAERLVDSLQWLNEEDRLASLPVGLFGASTGAAAALRAAADESAHVRAVVSRGGRPDLAIDVANRVEAPTLLIVGGHDWQVIDLNRLAFEKLRGAKDLAVVGKATHLFEEPGALEEVADLARDWFLRFLPRMLPSERRRETEARL